MAATEQKFNIKVATQGTESLTTLKAKLANLGKEVNATKTGFQGAAAEIKKVQSSTDQSVNSLRNFAFSWRELANSVSVTSKEFREYTREAEKAERAAAKFSGAQAKSGRFGGAAKIAGTVAASGVFGGPEGALGALGGALVGGVGGAAVGGAIGAQVGMLRQQIAALSTFVAEVNKSRIALAGVSKDQQDYGKSIKDVTALSRDYLLPIGDATQQYTKLKASVVGAGLGTKETTTVFRGIAAAVVATGGSAEDLNAALRATSQVFSKGKVSAEELRQQIGERLPGAFTIFAQSVGKTPQQLDKALEDGKVTLADFYTFTQELLKRYGSTAEILAKAPENAGARLKVALSVAGLAYAGFFQVIGAGFQNQATQLVEWALNNEVAIKRVVTIFAIGFNELSRVVAGFAKFLVGVFNAAFTLLLGNLNTVMQRVENAINRMKAVQKLTPGKIESFQKEAQAATNKKFGGPGGMFTFLRAGEAEPYYNQYFDNLVDTATKSAGAQKYTNKIQNILFPDFKPSSFGAGVGATLPSGIGKESGTGDSKKGVKSKKDTTKKTSVEMLALTTQLNKAIQDGNEYESITLQYKVNELKVSEALAAKQIDFNTAQKQNAENTTKLGKALEAAFAGLGRGAMDSLAKNKELEKSLINIQEKAGIITKEKAEELRFEQEIATLREQFKGEGGTPTLLASLEEAIAKLREAREVAGTVGGKVTASLKEAYKSATDLGTNLAGVAVSGVNGLADAFTELALTGKASFADLARSILADLSKIFMRMAVFKFFDFAFPGLGLSKSANGNIFAQNGIQKFAMGGVVTRPTLFPFANGTGLMGEAGPEAIMPLQRAANGKLGVVASNGGTTNVTVNVDAGGTSVEGDQAQAKQLGVVVSAAVQAELVKQQRPGGLLAGTRR